PRLDSQILQPRGDPLGTPVTGDSLFFRLPHASLLVLEVLAEFRRAALAVFDSLSHCLKWHVVGFGDLSGRHGVLTDREAIKGSRPNAAALDGKLSEARLRVPFQPLPHFAVRRVHGPAPWFSPF